MKHVVKPVVVRLHVVVGKPISDEHPVAFLKYEFCAIHLSFVYLHTDLSGDLLIKIEMLIPRPGNGPWDPPVFNFFDVLACRIRQPNFSSRSPRG